MYHFFVEPSQVRGNFISILGGDVNHMKNVLRMKAGEAVVISDGFGHEYLCLAEEFLENEVRCVIQEARQAVSELPSRIVLFQCLPKGDKMELIIQKAVELGAYAVIPVETKRCVVKLDAKKAEKRIARWQQISESAAKQSKRMLVPEIKPIMSFREALKAAEELDICLIPYEFARGMKKTREIIETITPGKSIGIFIGPEGGFEETEVAAAVKTGAKPITLGKRILRTETAGLAILSVLMFNLESEEEEI